MLLWAGVILILLGTACLPFDRRAAHYLYDHVSEGFDAFLERTTHAAKASHWLIAAGLAYGLAQAALALRGDSHPWHVVSKYALTFYVSLGIGSALLHAVKLIVGRRRPRDDMEMERYGFEWFSFDLQYNSFPSGHALTIMCVAVIATCLVPWLAVLWFGLALWLGLTRALLTAHFLSDVLVGAGIGLLAAHGTLVYVFHSLRPAWA